MWRSAITRLALASFVNRTDTELVSVSFDQIRYFASSDISLNSGALFPVRCESILLFNDITCNGSATISLWPGPFQLDEVSVEVLDFGSSRFASDVERILGFGSMWRGKRFRFALPGKKTLSFYCIIRQII